MNRITNLILSFFDLLEAEGRSFRTHTERAVRGILILFFGGVLLTSAALFAGYGFFNFLAYVLGLGVPESSLAVALLLGGGGYALIRRGLAEERPLNTANAADSCSALRADASGKKEERDETSNQ